MTAPAGPEGTFVKVYDDNIDEAVETVLNANLVATAVRTFMADRKEWSGTATDLLELLGKVAGDIAIKAKPGRPTHAARRQAAAGVALRASISTQVITAFSNPHRYSTCLGHAWCTDLPT